MSIPPSPTGGTSPIDVSTASAVALAATEDPGQHARVLAVAGPQELAVLALAEPVDVEDPRQLGALAAADLQPVAEVVSHVVATERQHRHRVPAQPTDLAPTPPRSVSEDIVEPRKTPCSQSRASYTSGTTVERRPPNSIASIGTPRGSSHSAAIDGHLGSGRREAGVGMGGGRLGIRRPVVAAPIDRVGRRLAGQPLPPDVAVVGLRAVGEDRVASDRIDRVGVGASPRSPAPRRRTRPRG